MEEIDALIQLGFEEREAHIYITLLKNQATTASKISEKIGVDRTTTYDILARMIENGVVSYAIKNNVKYFQPADPTHILQDLKEKERTFQEILPKLEALSKMEKEETKVELFKGKEGLKTVLKIMLKDKKDYTMAGGGKEMSGFFPIYINQWLRKAHKLNIRGRILAEESFGDHPTDIIGENENYRMTSKKFVSLTTFVWGDKTAFGIFTAPLYVVLITNKEVADRQRIYFDYLWKLAKKPTKAHQRKVLIK